MMFPQKTRSTIVAGVLIIVSAAINIVFSLVGFSNVSLRDSGHFYDLIIASITLSTVLTGLAAGVMSLVRRRYSLVVVGTSLLLSTAVYEELRAINAFFYYEHLLFGSNMPRPMPSEVWSYLYLQLFLCFNAATIVLSLAGLVLVVRSKRARFATSVGR
jgi:hypothetical protein